jgi:type I restriction enzyme S subunit
LYQITTWNKKFQGIENIMQPSINEFSCQISAHEMKKIKFDAYGDIRLLSTGRFEAYTNNIKKYHIGEILTIPSGGEANIKYHNGKFINSGNLLACSSDPSKYSLKYI